MKSKNQQIEESDQLIPPELELFSSKFRKKELDLVIKKKYGELAKRLKTKVTWDIVGISLVFIVALVIIFTWMIDNIPIVWLAYVLAGCALILYALLLRDQIVRFKTLQDIIATNQDDTSEEDQS